MIGGPPAKPPVKGWYSFVNCNTHSINGANHSSLIGSIQSEYYSYNVNLLIHSMDLLYLVILMISLSVYDQFFFTLMKFMVSEESREVENISSSCTWCYIPYFKLTGLVLWLMSDFLLLVVKKVILWPNLDPLFLSALEGMKWVGWVFTTFIFI